MVKKYTRVSNDQRKELIRLIYEENLTIKDAGARCGIPYPNAKAINQTYILERRTAKKTFRFRLKNVDDGYHVEKTQILIEKPNLFN